MKKIITLICVLCLSVCLSSCGEDASNKDASKETEVKDTVLQIGDIASLDDWEVVIEGAEVVQSVEDQFAVFTPEETTDQYLEVSASVKNKGSERRIFSPYIPNEKTDTYLELICKEKYKYTPNTLLGYADALDNVSVDPISTKTGKLHFAFPKELGDSTDDMIVRIISKGEKVEISLKQVGSQTSQSKETSQATKTEKTSSKTVTSTNTTSSNNFTEQIVGMWAGNWMDGGHIEFQFLHNNDFYCDLYYGNDYNSTQGKYWLEGNQLNLDTGETYTIKSVGNGILKLKTYGGTYSLDRMAV